MSSSHILEDWSESLSQECSYFHPIISFHSSTILLPIFIRKIKQYRVQIYGYFSSNFFFLYLEGAFLVENSNLWRRAKKYANKWRNSWTLVAYFHVYCFWRDLFKNYLIKVSSKWCIYYKNILWSNLEKWEKIWIFQAILRRSYSK